MDLDETHLAILELLSADARMSVSSVAEQVGVSRATAYARIASMERSGVIRGYHADVDPAAVGNTVVALVFVSLMQSQWADFRSRLETVPELEYFAVTTGQFDAMLLVRSRDVAAIHALVVDDLAQWPSVKATETVFLMDEATRPFRIQAPRRLRREADYGSTRFVGAPSSRRRRK